MIYLCMISIKKYILYLYFSNPLVIVVNYFWMTWDKMVVSSCQLSKNLPFFKLFKERIQLLPSVSFKNSSRILWRSSWNVSQNNEWEFRFCCLMEMVFFKMYSKKNCITSLFSGLYFVDAECNFFSKLYIPWNFFKCSNTYLLAITYFRMNEWFYFKADSF